VIDIDNSEDFEQALKRKHSSYTPQDYKLPPDPPKKAPCAFFLYRIDIYELIKAEEPKMPMIEITRVIGEMWKSIEPALKERYEQESMLNRQIVEEQKRRYEEMYGRPKSGRNKKVKRDMKQIRKLFEEGK
jgi:hypothetical protein